MDKNGKPTLAVVLAPVGPRVSTPLLRRNYNYIRANFKPFFWYLKAKHYANCFYGFPKYGFRLKTAIVLENLFKVTTVRATTKVDLGLFFLF